MHAKIKKANEQIKETIKDIIRQNMSPFEPKLKITLQKEIFQAIDNGFSEINKHIPFLDLATIAELVIKLKELEPFLDLAHRACFSTRK